MKTIQEEHWKYHSKRTIEKVGAFFVPFLKAGGCCLDAGCGLGSITNSLVKYVVKNGTGSVYGIDCNPNAINKAKECFSNIEGLTYAEGNLYDLPYDNNTFDNVFCHGVIIHSEFPEKMLKEFYRVLKPEGTIGISAVDHDSLLLYPENVLLRKSIWLQEQIYAKGSGWGSSIREKGNLYIGKKLRSLLFESGFTDVKGFARAECDASPEAIKNAALQQIGELQSPIFIKKAMELQLTTIEEIEQMKKAWDNFGQDPCAYRAKIICEAVARKEN